MGYYTNEKINISEIYKYDSKKYSEKKEFENYLLSIVFTTIIIVAIMLFLKSYLNIKLVSFLLITGLVLIVGIGISSFLFNGHNSATTRIFAYGDERVFIIEEVPENNRTIIGLTSNTIKPGDITISYANEILNSTKPVKNYAYEIIGAKSFLITPQGVAYKLKVKKKIYYNNSPEIKITTMRINISNRYSDFSNLLKRIENL